MLSLINYLQRKGKKSMLDLIFFLLAMAWGVSIQSKISSMRWAWSLNSLCEEWVTYEWNRAHLWRSGIRCICKGSSAEWRSRWLENRRQFCGRYFHPSCCSRRWWCGDCYSSTNFMNTKTTRIIIQLSTVFQYPSYTCANNSTTAVAPCL